MRMSYEQTALPPVFYLEFRGDAQTRSINFCPGFSSLDPANVRFLPDDVDVFCGHDYDAQAFRGGERWLSEMSAKRSDRRAAWQRIAGDMGLAILREIEKEEGWPG